MHSLIKSFTIKNLFNKYKVELPFDEPIKVLIGENGSGKTTILNAMYYTLSTNFNRLKELDFDKIIIEFSSGDKAVILRENIFRRSRKGLPIELVRMEKMLSRSEYTNLLSMIERGISIEGTRYEKILSDIDITPARFNILKHYLDQYNSDNATYSINRAAEIIRDNFKYNIIHLPTYRRIEEDLRSLNVTPNDISVSINSRQHNLYSNFKQVQFGMSDVKDTIERVKGVIKTSSREYLVKITSDILRDLACKKNIEVDRNMDKETLMIVVERMGDYFSKDEKDIIRSYVNQDVYGLDDKFIPYFLSKLIEIYEAQQSTEMAIDKFISVCNSYLNKTKIVYDKSLVNISVIHKETGKVLEFNNLSSGEKQVISLFSKIYLEDIGEFAILFDEPELSLSLEWQQRLLPDIISSGRCGFLTVVTHSPFIFKNELMKYAVGIDMFMEG